MEATQTEKLTFKKFTKREKKLPVYNNLILHFLPGTIGELYRSQEHYKELAQKNPELIRKLETAMKELYNGNNSSRTLRKFERELYEAYLTMRDYVDSDAQLFA